MSFTTIIAILFAFSLFLGAIFISTDNYMIFLSGAAFVMVFGGTMASTFIAYEPRYALLSLRLIYRVILSPKVSRNVLKAEVGRIIKWAYTMQKKGLPAVEVEARKSTQGDRFLRFGVDMVVSNYSGDEVREILSNSIESSYNRNSIQVDILRDMAAAAPAFGMIGTLVGLVIMLDGMGSDPSQLGRGLAVALLTTLYGVLLSRLVLIPVANKVQQREDIIRFRNHLVAEGLALIAENRSPRYIQDKMNSYIDPSLHFNIDKMKR